MLSTSPGPSKITLGDESFTTSENREEEYRRAREKLNEKSLGVFVLTYQIKTDRKDPVGALVSTATGFVEGRVGLITFGPYPGRK